VSNRGQGNCGYTPLSTLTNTVSPGGTPSGPGTGYFTTFYGVSVLGLGTNTAITVNAYEVIPPTGLGTNTGTVTNQLTNGTATAAGMMITAAGPAAQGVRLSGHLVVVLSNIVGVTANALWD
jgi:hypothetical protein